MLFKNLLRTIFHLTGIKPYNIWRLSCMRKGKTSGRKKTKKKEEEGGGGGGGEEDENNDDDDAEEGKKRSE